MGSCDGDYPVPPAWVVALSVTPQLGDGRPLTRACVQVPWIRWNEEEMPEVTRQGASSGRILGWRLVYNQRLLCSCPHPYKLTTRHAPHGGSYWRSSWPLLALPQADPLLSSCAVGSRHLGCSGRWSFSTFSCWEQPKRMWFTMFLHLCFDRGSYLLFVRRAHNTTNSQAQIMSNSMLSVN